MPNLNILSASSGVMDSLLENGSYTPHVQARRRCVVSPDVDPAMRLKSRCFNSKYKNHSVQLATSHHPVRRSALKISQTVS